MSVNAPQRSHLRAVLRQAREDAVALPTPGRPEPTLSPEVLLGLHREWVRLLVGRLHRGGIVAARAAAEVRELYDEARSANPTLRRVLEAHADHPALADPVAGEHAMLARLGGLVPDAAPRSAAAAAGRTLLEEWMPGQRTSA